MSWDEIRKDWRLKDCDMFWQRGVLLRVRYVDYGAGYRYERVD